MTKTISEEYLNLQKDLHLRSDYGTASLGIAPEVKQIFEKYNYKSISDYGAGKCNLQKKLMPRQVQTLPLNNLNKHIELKLPTHILLQL